MPPPELRTRAPRVDLLRRATAELRAAGCDSPRLDAELLLAEALGTTRAGLLLAGSETAPPAAAARFEELLARRAAREPVAYILGRRPFRRLELQVDPRVLIPRPETELLVEVGLDLPRGASVADVGTGSGAVALALADEREDLRVTATDVSEEALAVARGNARRLGLAVQFVRGDLLSGLAGRFDAVLANLPYVAEAERGGLAPEILRYEPPGALFAGADGLAVIRRLVAQLEEVSLVALEVGVRQSTEVARRLGEAGFAHTQVRHDLAGHERVVVGWR